MSNTADASPGRTRARSTGIASQMLRGIVETNDIVNFRKINPTLLREEEVPAYTFINLYVRRHNRLPSVQACQENQVTLALMAADTFDYYQDRLVERFEYDTLAEGVAQRAMPLLTGRDVQGAKAVLRETIQRLDALSPNNDLSTLADNAPQMIAAYYDAQRHPNRRYVTLGYDKLDDLTGGGARAGDVIVIAGRPNVGKSYILLWMIVQAWRQGHPLMVSSMEMRRERIEERIIALDTGFNPDSIRKGRLDRWAQDELIATLLNLSDRPPIHSLAGRYRKSVSDFRRGIEACRPAAAYIDAAYLASPDTNGGRAPDKRHDRIADVIEQIKDVAEDTGIPIFVTVQFNREVRTGTKPKPMDLATIAGSDAIPQIASVVIGAQHGFAPNEKVQRRLEMGKNREGPTCELDINFLFRPRMDLSALPFTVGHNGGPPLDDDNAPMAVPQMVGALAPEDI